MNTPVNFEIAKLLKEKGFDKPTQRAYIGNDNLFVNFEQSYGETDFYFDADDFYENWNKKGWVFNRNGEGCFGCKLDNIQYFEAYAAPTIADVVMWLYEKYGIWIAVDIDGNKTFYSTVSFRHHIIEGLHYNSPIETYEAAIFYILKHLI